MKHTELKWKSRDGLGIFAQSWEPDTRAPKAGVCLVHGLGEHSSRYAHVAEAFCKEGYVLFAADSRGHGRSEGARGYINSIEDFMQDIDVLSEQVGLHYGGLPVFLYGHSLGGILVLYYSLQRRPKVKGVIATSPALHSALENQPVKVMAAKILGAFLPTVEVPTGLDAKAISRDDKVVQTYFNDPLVHGKASLGFGKAMLGVTQWTLEHAGEFSLPLLLMHGKADEIAFPSSSIEFAAKLKNNCTLMLWDGGYHELQNDLEQAEVLKTMTIWMDARMKE